VRQRATVISTFIQQHNDRDPSRKIYIAQQVTPLMVGAAMQRMPYWNQGPANYLDMFLAINSALNEV
jgi:hypothetical protein